MVGTLADKYIREKGMKKIFVAEEMGIAPQVLNEILRDKRKVEVGEYFRLCKAIGVDAVAFAEEAGITQAAAAEA